MQKEAKMLELTRFGEGSRRKLLIAHGLFGSARNWGAIAKSLSATFEVVVVDMRNHGQSFHSDDMDYSAMAGDLAEVIQAEGGRMSVLGHSMGGKAAMMLALTAPQMVERLVVGDIAPVSYGHSHMEHIDAMQGLDLSKVMRRSDADRALAEVVSDRGVRAFLLQSLDISGGQARWRLNLPVLRAHMQTFVSFPQVEGAFEGPTLFLGGAQSEYITAEGRRAIQRHFPGAHVVMLKNAGHWLHADQPEAFTKTVSAFLNVREEG